MKFKKSQSGRSMVEMLGVLAIIGVLSVGGIAGYSLSMRRHRANQIIDLAAKYSLITYGNCQQKFINDNHEIHCERNIVPFENSGLGNLPAGVTAFETGDIFLNSEDGSDDVTVYIHFSDTKLCQAVGSITGTGCGSWGVYIVFKHD